jgi:large subunit ribosomal protein L21
MRGKITALVAAATAAVGAASAAKWARGRKDAGELEREVSAPTKTPAAAGAATSTPAADTSPAAHTPPAADTSPSPVVTAADDLTAIRGLGKVKVAKLVAAGVTTYAQVAAWSDEDIAGYGLQTNTSPGQIKREDWVGQAKALAGD